MAYTLGTAAMACGANKSTILRSIKAGKIAAIRDEQGQWQIEPAELHRVYPAISTQQPTPPDATSEVVALLRQQLAEMRETLERERSASDVWRKAFEEERAQRVLAAPSHPTQPLPQQPAPPAPFAARAPAAGSEPGRAGMMPVHSAPPATLPSWWRWLRSTG